MNLNFAGVELFASTTCQGLCETAGRDAYKLPVAVSADMFML